jgi:hypothetical protein
MQVPFPELTDLELYSHDEALPAIPDSFFDRSSPRLRIFVLDDIPFPGSPKFILSANHLCLPWARQFSSFPVHITRSDVVRPRNTFPWIPIASIRVSPWLGKPKSASTKTLCPPRCRPILFQRCYRVSRGPRGHSSTPINSNAWL